MLLGTIGLALPATAQSPVRYTEALRCRGQQSHCATLPMSRRRIIERRGRRGGLNSRAEFYSQVYSEVYSDALEVYSEVHSYVYSRMNLVTLFNPLGKFTRRFTPGVSVFTPE